jgi:hypothetical protein
VSSCQAACKEQPAADKTAASAAKAGGGKKEGSKKTAAAAGDGSDDAAGSCGGSVDASEGSFLKGMPTLPFGLVRPLSFLAGCFHHF